VIAASAELSASELRTRQREAALKTVTDHPGWTAYMIGMYVPVPQPTVGERVKTGLLAVSADMTLVLALLADLAKDGKVRSEPDDQRLRWYPLQGGTEGGLA
jgi:hypothetical protein